MQAVMYKKSLVTLVEFSLVVHFWAAMVPKYWTSRGTDDQRSARSSASWDWGSFWFMFSAFLWLFSLTMQEQASRSLFYSRWMWPNADKNNEKKEHQEITAICPLSSNFYHTSQENIMLRAFLGFPSVEKWIDICYWILPSNNRTASIKT